MDYKQQGDELSHYESVADTASQQLRKLNIKYEMLKVGEWKVCTVWNQPMMCACVQYSMHTL